MKFHTKRTRRLRRLALAGCIVAVVAPSSASAMLPNDVGVRHENAQQSEPYTLPSSYRSEVGIRHENAQQSEPYTLPSSFRPEVQTASSQSTPVQPFTLHKGFKPEVQTSAPTQSAPQSPTIVRQIETVSDNSGKTLAIVLASVALAVALGSLAYATIRMTRMQRRELGSH
jgi:hypothetical protein